VTRLRWMVPVGESGHVDLSVKGNGEFWFVFVDPDADQKETCLIVDRDELLELRRIIDAATVDGGEGER